MAARTRLPFLFSRSLPLYNDCKYAHTEVLVKQPGYPPIVPSLTAKSKSARQRQVEEQVKMICASPVEEKLFFITRVQWMKFVVYPQTFARNADKWYQHFTKTAYIPGLPDKFTLDSEEFTDVEGSPQAAVQTTLPGIEDDAFADIRSMVTNVILQERWHMKKRKPFLYRVQEHTFGPLLRNLVSGLTHSLSKYNPQLLLCSLGMAPRTLNQFIVRICLLVVILAIQ